MRQRKIKYVRYALFLASTLAVHAWAQGNVLLPSDTSSSNGPPNLGLTPSLPESPPPVAVKNPEPQPVQEKPQVTTPAATTPPAAPPPARQFAPVPVRMPPPPIQPTSAYKITVTLSKGVFSTGDIENISTQLGIPKNQVTDQCQMGINGMLMTNQGAPAIESNGTASVVVPYDGAITNTMLGIYAACISAPKPIQPNFLQHIAGRYALALASTNCTPSTPAAGTMHQILVTHAGNGNDTCIFQ